MERLGSRGRSRGGAWKFLVKYQHQIRDKISILTWVAVSGLPVQMTFVYNGDTFNSVGESV